MAQSGRDAVLQYARAQYGTAPEYLWARFPGYAALRHGASGKWYALLMDVPAQKLGLEGDGRIDILEIKCDSLMLGSLLARAGILPAYHMNRGNWVSLRLDGALPPDEIFALLDLSYRLAGPGKQRR